MQVDNEDTRILEAGISFVFMENNILFSITHIVYLKVCYGRSIDTEARKKGVIKEISLCLEEKWKRDHF